MSAFGDHLRQERENRGIALEEIAASTKISRHHLEALEAGQLDRLPGGAFNKGFVRAYAEFLGIDAGDAVQGYLREERAQGLTDVTDSEAVRQTMARLAEQRRKEGYGPLLSRPSLRVLLVAAPALAVLVATLWWWMGRSGPAARQPEAVLATASPQAPPAPMPGSNSTSPPETAAAAGSPAPDREIPAPVPAAPATVEAVPPGPAAVKPAPTPAEPAASAPAPPEPAGPSPAASPGLRVSEFGTGMDVIDRTLVGQQDRFREGTLAWFWTRVLGGAPGDTVEHVWLHDGQVAARHAIQVGGPHWRVYTRQTLAPGSAGHWAVEARDAHGRVLARNEFEVVRD